MPCVSDVNNKKEAAYAASFLFTMQTMNIRQADKAEIKTINQFYKQQAKGQAKKGECIWLTEHKQQIIAALRIQPLFDEPNSALLLGVFVDPNFRQQGIASKLVTTACRNWQSDNADKTLYTFPYQKLTAWYQTLGFTSSTRADLPLGIESRYKRYSELNKELVVMRLSKR
ncbi:GNAT family N-acetyltransferase [Catenovulum sp. SM1970]|uniref:GNAT family N-acetyltransferase n=1 Tax=Marinifaba aquimaris TaxID=2741323 RepID=UPI0015717973|nr:GNAT family N-acetyltransferase [Marinifaba aquimaris]NTS77272.1 GNAT family N-acetyltransferase [Marinifaba aquimaris]